MLVAEELADVQPGADTLLTIGVLDGVHLGHQHLVRTLVERSRERGLLSGVVTFRQHPEDVLFPERRLPYLTTLSERIDLLRGLGVDLVAPLSFTGELAGLPAREFVGLLRDHLRVRGLVIGPDFALGRGREGDSQALKGLGKELGFTVEVVPPFRLDGEIVSSTAIKKCLARGDLASASRLLGRPFTLRGPVVRGRERGRHLGFPTANIAVDSGQALPAYGIYATRVCVEGRTLNSVTNIGVRPTFGETERSVEVFIVDFSGDLYGQELRLELVKRLREEKRFDSVGDLVAQMGKDVNMAREVLQR